MTGVPSYTVQTHAIFDGADDRYTIIWEDSLFAKTPEALEVRCRVCAGALRIVGAELVVRGQKLHAGARGALSRFRTEHDGCVPKKAKTRGVPQQLPGLGSTTTRVRKRAGRTELVLKED